MSRPSMLRLIAIGATLVLGACSGTPASETPSSAATPMATTTATATPAPAGSPTASSPAEASGVPTALDPCELVTAAEASALAGASFGAGTEGTTSGGGRTCVYGSTATAIVQVLVAQAPDASTAQADWTQEQAQAEAALKQAMPAGVDLTFKVSDASVTGADQAAAVTAKATFSGVTIGVSGIYVLKGATFFTFSELALGGDAASLSAMEAQAVVTLGRVP
jgi:hypothetical protein